MILLNCLEVLLDTQVLEQSSGLLPSAQGQRHEGSEAGDLLGTQLIPTSPMWPAPGLLTLHALFP